MNTKHDSQKHIPHYDPHLIPAESAARQHREGQNFGHPPHDGPNEASSHTTDGYTVDQEGLINNYPIEPEMYVEVPGDLREQAAQEVAEHAHEMQELSEDEDGKLTMKHDWRHKGPGLI
ncbi:hypothetical protein [Nodosilinea sp. P-1105]|uniref:hypothetical protein n=1 Tax=Nodosilinea sp. P-1105 TaxID=2546229 RepID=UPI00146C5985|nr:hypothetical protein [Nodosilinea sp. P-1105]NMF86379.1 hypothetical protein [Nodosilinea sp. P-1105]